MAGRTPAYTHRDWRVAAADLAEALTTTLGGALEHMHAGLVSAEAGRDQVQMAAQWTALARDAGKQGLDILRDHDARLRRVGEEQAAVGHDQVAGQKEYHQR